MAEVAKMSALNQSKRHRAIVLLSGGLDSALAAHLIKRQGIEVVGLHFILPLVLRRRTIQLKLPTGLAYH